MTLLFNRICEISIAGRVLTYPPMHIEFEKEFADSVPAQTTARIINPSPDTVAACEKKGGAFPPVIISAGYMDIYGTCVTGEIVKYELKPGLDKVLELKISDKSSLWAGAVLNTSFKGSVSARDVVKQVFNSVGLVSPEIKFAKEKTYERGIHLGGVTFKSAMERIARDTGTRFFFRNGKATFLPADASTGVAQVLGYETGLLSAVKTTSGYEIKALFMWDVDAGSYVQLKRDGESVNLRVKKGKLKFSPTGQAGTEFEAVVLK